MGPDLLSNIYSIIILTGCSVVLTGVSASNRFRIFWNIPLKTCASLGVDLHPARYGFTVNAQNRFIGGKIALLYRPGAFPYIFDNGTVFNGGIPQLGNLTTHLNILTHQINTLIPNKNFHGLAVIDCEKYEPFFHRAPLIYRQHSIDLAHRKYPTYNSTMILAEAAKSFNRAARMFLEQSLMASVGMRPRGHWGFYQYPLCRNLGIASGKCRHDIAEENDRLRWLFDKSGGVYASLYVYSGNYTDLDRRRFVRGHLDEVRRLRLTSLTYPYVMAQYHDRDGVFVSKADLESMLLLPYLAGMPGAVLFGKSSSVNSTTTCRSMKLYLKRRLGPLVYRLTSRPHANI